MSGGLYYLLLLWIYFIHAVDGNIPPYVRSANAVITKSEATPVGSVLTTVTASDTDGPRPLIFTVGNNETGQLVRLNNSRLLQKGGHEWSVDVILKKQLDRDFHPAKRQLLFQVSDGLNKVSDRLILYITDVNDETPTLHNLPASINISETVLVSSTVFQVNATDPDAGVGSQLSFTLQYLDSARDQPFRIGAYTGIITLSKPLDFETTTSYRCNITVQDGGGLSNSADFDVTVLDAQDTPPVFEHPFYNIRIPETASKGSAVVRVRARDGDMTNPNKIYMSLEPGPCSSLFNIDPDTGEITVTGDLDRESGTIESNNGQCILNVTALEDNGNRMQYGPSSSSITVMVEITDVNDNHPTFNSGKVTAATSKYVVDGAPVIFKHPIMLSVSDADRGDNGILDIYLETIHDRLDEVFHVSPARAYSQAQIYLSVKNATALKNYQYSVMTVQLYAKEVSSSSHVAMVSVDIDVLDTHSQCKSIPIIG